MNKRIILSAVALGAIYLAYNTFNDTSLRMEKPLSTSKDTENIESQEQPKPVASNLKTFGKIIGLTAAGAAGSYIYYKNRRQSFD